MVSIKPDIDYLLGILHALLDDISSVNSIKNTEMDKLTIQQRTLHEGIGFLTKTLPKLGSAFDTALRTGKFVCPTEFRTHRSTALPCFTKGLLRRIFTDSGDLLPLEKVDFSAITEVRQLYYLCYKVESTFTEKQQIAASEVFKQNDSGLPSLASIDDGIVLFVLNLARDFCTLVFKGFDPYDIHPSHGPGIVASGEQPHEKRSFSTHYERIHNEYPYHRWFHVNRSDVFARIGLYWSRERKTVGTNKVLFVNKDSRGPRTIACEPLEYMFIQQGLRKALYHYVETHPFLRGRVNFTDQSINQFQAKLASLGNGKSTVDLKDASDRVSNELVEFLFGGVALLGPLQALRTPFSLLPTGEVIELKKYAAMGSALCFPVEAIVFFMISWAVQTALQKHTATTYVYGDDIICDSDEIPLLTKVMNAVGLVVNCKKTSSTGFFRESCGAEYYYGRDITNVKIRKADISSLDGLVSMVATSNLLWERGYYKAAKYIENYVSKHSDLIIPFGKCSSEYLCYTSSRFSMSPKGRKRYNKQLQRVEIRVPVVTGTSYSASVNTPAEGYGEYYRKVTQGWSPYFRSGSYVKRKLKLAMKWVDANL